MTYCRGPKTKNLRTQPNRPLIAVKSANGCGCSGGITTPFLDIKRAGVKDATVYRYPVYSYNSAGDPQFFLDFNVLNTPAIYDATLLSFNQYQSDVNLRFVECGTFQLVIGLACSLNSTYVSTPANAPTDVGRTPAGTFPYDDMQPSYALEPVLS